MSNKLTPRPMPQAKMKPMTDEEKQARIMQFLAQKREAFAINILNGLCANLDKDATNTHAKNLVALSVEMADDLIGRLYPIKEESK